MPIANINSVKLNYEVSGQGKDIVLLHGYVGDIEDWRNQIALLSPEYRVSILDQRGRGKSEAPENEDAYSIGIFVEDVYQWMKLVKIEECCLTGHSLGGMVSLAFTLAHPEMVRALVLADTSSEKTTVPPEMTRFRETVNKIALTEGMGAAFDYDLANNPASKGRYQKHPQTLARMRAKTQTTPAYGYVNIWKALRNRESVTGRLSEISVPTLIIYAEDDLPFAISGAKVMHQEIASSELVMIKNSGHGSMYEKPEEFNEILTKFLNRIKW